MKFKYKGYEQNLILLKGIADIHPYELKLPDAPKPELITNFGKHPDEQYFQRVQFPHELKKIDNLVKKGIITRQQGIEAIESDPVLTAFVEMLWRKRLGEELEFQYINGVPTYISPTYWFYLNFWHLDTGLPDFRTDKYHNCGDLEEFYCWDLLVVPSPICYGLTELSGRRGGKSYKMGCIVYEPVSRSYEGHGYIQSKTDLDAERAFVKTVVKPWRQLPFFFQPIFSNSSFPKKEGMQFTPRSKKGIGGETELIDDEILMSEIVYVSSEIMAIDGQKALREGEDETGKGGIDVYERWVVNKFTLVDKGQIVGKAYHPTTVEEMEKKGGKYYKAKWMDSDRSPIKRSIEDVKVDENGETTSGLWQWFIPAYCNEVFDEYGTAIVDKITEKQKLYLKAQKYRYWKMTGMESVDHQINSQKNPFKRQDIIRKKPRNIKEAFQSATHFSNFNMDILNKRLGDFIHGYRNWKELEYMKFGKFDWVGEPFKSDVKFTEQDYINARAHISMFPREGMQNMKIPITKTKFRPANTALFRSGADPFKYDTPDVKNPSKMSMGAQHIYAFYDPLVDGSKERSEWKTNNIIYEYIYRPQSKDELFEDYLKACIFYGCQLYPERNNSDVLDYFKRHGFEHYIQYGIRIAANASDGIHYKEDTVGGDITGTLVIQKMFRHVEDWVNKDASSCVFFRTLQQVLDVEKENITKFDAFVSLAYTLMASYEAEIVKLQAQQNNNGSDTVMSRNDLEVFVGSELNLN